LTAPSLPPSSVLAPPPAIGVTAEKSFLAGAAQKDDWPSDRWWESFADERLNQMVERALAGSPDIKMARARAQLAENIAMAAGAATSVTASAGGSVGLQQMSENSLIPAEFLDNPYTNAEITLNLGYNLDLWGAARMAAEGKIGKLKAAQAEEQAVRLAITAAVARSYFSLQSIVGLHHVARNALDARRQSMEMIRMKLERGLETELNLERALFAMTGDEDLLATLEQAEALERTQLAALAGAGPDDGSLIAISTPAEGIASAPLPEGLPLDLVHRRADIAAARWRVEAAAKEVGSARAEYYPNINLRALGGLQTVDIGQLFSSGSLMYNAMSAIHLPLYDGGALGANLGARGAEYDMAVEKYNQTLLQAAQEVAGALAQLEGAAKRMDIAHRALATARKVYRLTMTRFDKGLDDYLTALKAQDEVFAQERKLALLQGAALQARVALVAALGGGFMDNDSRQKEASGK
ncbi:MAG: efflux transporter outer membrane subunit, partial [Nitrospinota bacterium]|nr:efflux transporter outer membrane subunit [Nitrospinota bacterium]